MVHAGRHRWMRQLEQDGSAPAGDHDRLAVDLPGDAVGPGAPVVRPEETRAYRVAMPLDPIWCLGHLRLQSSHGLAIQCLSSHPRSLQRRLSIA